MPVKRRLNPWGGGRFSPHIPDPLDGKEVEKNMLERKIIAIRESHKKKTKKKNINQIRNME